MPKKDKNTNSKSTQNLESLRQFAVPNFVDEEDDEELEAEWPKANARENAPQANVAENAPKVEEKKKNFFDMDDEDEEIEQEKNPPLRSNDQLDSNKNYKAQLNELFGEDDDEPIAEQEDPVNNEIANEKRPISRADFPHIFVDEGNNDVRNVNMPEAHKEEPVEEQINEVQANEVQANEVQANEVQANEVQVNNNPPKQNIPQSRAERMELLRQQVLGVQDEDEDEIDEDELDGEEAYAQHLMDGIKANMPSKNSPNARYYYPENNVEQPEAPQQEEKNPQQEENFVINNNPPKQNIPQSKEARMELLRQQVMAGRDEEEVDEDELEEAQAVEDAQVARIMASIKANAPQKKEPTAKNDALFPPVQFEIPQTGKIDPSFFEDDEDEEIELNTNPNANNKQNANNAPKETDAKQAEEINPVNSEARVAVYNEKLKAYNNMYKLNIDSNNFASSVIEAWNLMRSGDNQKIADGQKVMNNLFKDTLKKAFDVEKGVAYDEHRLPEYTEIAKSANELLRSAMYGFTDLYHSPNTQKLFDATSFGGLNAKDMADLTTGESLWSMDQKSDEAWEIQSKAAKGIAEEWLKEDKPYEKMINEMKALVKSDKDGIVSRKDVLDKLTAAEWLLTNNEKMMVEDPEDPLNPIPNWGNRYWKALSEAREALGIDKHTSMRDLIQGDYAASAKAVGNANYNKTQMQLYVVDRDMRALFDSMEIQKEQFATQSAAVTLTEPQTDKNAEEIEMTGVRVPHPVPELDERTIMQNQPKNYDFVIEPQTELNLTAQNQAQAK